MTLRKHFTSKPIFFLIFASFFLLSHKTITYIDFKRTYVFNYSIDTLKSKIYSLKYIENIYQMENYLIDSTGRYLNHKLYGDTLKVGHFQIDKFVKDTMRLEIYDNFCFNGYFANFIISGDTKKSMLSLIGFTHFCAEDKRKFLKWKSDKYKLSKSFKRIIIMQLNEK